MLSPITRAEPTSPVSQMKETFRRMSAQRDAAAEWRTPDRRDSQPHQPQQYPAPNSLLLPFRNSSGPSFASPYTSTPTTTTATTHYGSGLSSSTVPHYNSLPFTSNPPHAALSSSSTTPYDRMITIGGSGSRSTIYSKSPPSLPRPFPSQLPASSGGDEDQFDRGYAERRLEERTSRGSPRVFSEAAPVNSHSSSHPPTPPRWAPSSSSSAGVGGRGPQPVTFLPNRTAANGAADDDRLPQPILFPTDTFAPPPPLMQSPLPRVPQARESSYRDGTVSSGSGSNQRNSRSVSGSAGARHAPAAAAEYSDEFPLSFVTASIEGPHISDFYGRAIPVPTALATAAPPEVLATFNGARAPSALLSTIVEAVWIARGGRQPQQQPPVIPNEVVDAFDGLLYDGAYFVKYSPHGTPHERYFAIRMVEVSGVSREPCLTWSVHKTSWSMKGVVNLAELHSIVEGTVDCPAFERHLIDAFHIKGPMFGGPKRATLSTECTVQLIGGAEPLALLGLNAAVFKALLVFLKYIAKVGRGEMDSRRSYPR